MEAAEFGIAPDRRTPRRAGSHGSSGRASGGHGFPRGDGLRESLLSGPDAE